MKAHVIGRSINQEEDAVGQSSNTKFNYRSCDNSACRARTSYNLAV